jgi:hypothetical protein
MTDKQAREKITKLEERIRALESAATYFPHDKPHDATRWFAIELPRLTATDVISRFEQLYEHLGIKRELVTAVPEHTKLVKAPKPQHA